MFFIHIRTANQTVFITSKIKNETLERIKEILKFAVIVAVTYKIKFFICI